MDQTTSSEDICENDLLEDPTETCKIEDEMETDVKSDNVDNFSSAIAVMQQNMAQFQHAISAMTDACQSIVSSKRSMKDDDVTVVKRLKMSDNQGDHSHSIKPAEVDELMSSSGAPDGSLSESDEGDFLDEIDVALENTEAVGPPLVSDKLAKIGNKCFSGMLAFDQLKSKHEHYLRPKNCDSLVLPATNPEIRALADTLMKKRDQRLQFLQKDLITAATAIAQVTDTLIGAHKSKGKSSLPLKEMVTQLTDAMSLIGHTTYGLSMRRRDTYAPVLKREFSALLSPEIPVTQHLFGDDLPKTLTELKKANSINHDLKYAPKYYQPYPAKKGFHTKNSSAFFSQTSLTKTTVEPESSQKERSIVQKVKATSEVSAHNKHFPFKNDDNKKDEFQNTHIDFIHRVLQHSSTQLETFRAGRLCDFYDQWTNITKDPEILRIIKGCEIHFDEFAVSNHTSLQSQFFSRGNYGY